MARFAFWSDLHLEHQSFKMPSLSDFGGPIDAVFLPGDTDTGQALCHMRFAEKVSSVYGVPVVMVLGNHEYYGCEMKALEHAQADLLKTLRKNGHDIHVLNGDQVMIAGTRIVGATLWTDFDLDPATGLRARQIAQMQMNDFRLIKLDDGGIRPLTPADTVHLHIDQKNAVLSHLSQPHDGPTIVMTHHMPIAQGIHAQYLHDPVNAAFASNLMREIEELDFDAWVYGHSHHNNELEIEVDGRIKRFVSNPRGYPNEVTRFNPVRILEV
jgi:predicted phosphodiesterase